MTHTVLHAGYGITLNLSLDDLGHPDRPGLWEEIYEGPFTRGLLRCTVVENGTVCPEDMYVQIRDGIRVAAHCSLDAAPHATKPESSLHKALKERVATSASRAGLTVTMEDPADDRSRVTDVLVRGSAGKRIGWEIQLAGISPKKVLERSAIAAKDGITPQWTVTNPNAAPVNRAPWARLDEISDWRKVAGSHLAVRGGVRKLGLRECHPSYFRRCPDRKRGGPLFCGKHHPSLREAEVQLDDLIVWSAEGEYESLFVPANTAAGGAYVWLKTDEKAEFLQGQPESRPYASPATSTEPQPYQDPKPLDLACHYGEESETRSVRASRDSGLDIPAPNAARPPRPERVRVLDWRANQVGDPRPCRICQKPALMRDESGTPCHKVCAESCPD